MTITTKLLSVNPYSRPGTKLSKVTKIAVHYVGNPGSSAIANRNYFENLKDTKKTYASSHYIIGLDGEIIQCVPESEIAYCTNSANSYSISIENCHPTSDGKFSDKTNRSLIELCADLCERYKLNPLTDVIRHYDVTGKACPLYHVRNPSEWDTLKKDVNAYMSKVNKEEGELLTTMKVQIDDGEIHTINSVLKNDSNYPNLRELAALLGYSVSWQPVNKVVKLENQANN